MDYPLTLRDRLIRVGPERLADRLLEIADGDPALKRKIELLARENDPDAMAGELTRQIASVRRRETFVPCGESFALAAELQDLVDAIRGKVLPVLPSRAFELADAFLRTDALVFERVDDSAGNVADVYRDACWLWLDTAARSRGDEDWVKRVREMAVDNDYGARDALLPNAERLLSEHELRRLSRHYEEEAARARPDPATGIPLDARRCWSDVAQVAKALRDPVLFERAERNFGRWVDDRLRLEVARHCVEWGRIDEALTRLAEVPDSNGYERNSLLLACYERKGDVPRQVELLWRLFESVPGYETYSRMLELMPESQRRAARTKARDMVMAYRHAVTVIEFLLRDGWGDDAERVATELHNELDGVHYATLLELAGLAATAKRPRIEVVCYRSLLRNILHEKRSKAYGHAANYYRRLAQLDEEIVGHWPLCDHAAFVGELRANHGRKHGFWSRVETDGGALG
jgi:hypothetical protein